MFNTAIDYCGLITSRVAGTILLGCALLAGCATPMHRDTNKVPDNNASSYQRQAACNDCPWYVACTQPSVAQSAAKLHSDATGHDARAYNCYGSDDKK
jgi:hypothetical protein